MASTPSALPSPEEIVAREAQARRIATIGAVVSAVLVAIAVIVDQVVSADGVPSAERAADMVETFSARATGADFPASFWTAYAQFKVDHSAETILAAGLRGVSLILLVPIVLLLLRATRERGGTLSKFLEPLTIAALVSVGVATALQGVVEVNAFKSAGPEYIPGVVLDTLNESDLLVVNGARSFLSLVVALPISLMAVQAMRVGLLPRVLGFMGVLVGLLFVLPYDQTGLLRAFWFSAIAWVIAGRMPSGLPEAWQTGLPVSSGPRQPPEPKQPKNKSKGGGKSGEKPNLTK